MSWARRHPARYEQQPNHGQGYPLLPTGAGNRSHRRKWVYKQRRKFGTELLVVSLYIYLFSIMGTLVPIQLRQVEGAHSTLMGAAANAPSCLGTDGLWQDMTRWKNETRRHPRGWRTASIPLSQPLNSIDFYRQARNSNWPDPPPRVIPSDEVPMRSVLSLLETPATPTRPSGELAGPAHLPPHPSARPPHRVD